VTAHSFRRTTIPIARHNEIGNRMAEVGVGLIEIRKNDGPNADSESSTPDDST